MSVPEYMLTALSEKAPSARVFSNITLDGKRGKGLKADLLIVHKTGIYPVYYCDKEGYVYGAESAKCWILRSNEGEGDYFTNPLITARQATEALLSKCRGIEPRFVKPIVLYSDNTNIVDVSIKGTDIAFCGEEYFLAQFLLKEYEDEVVDAPTRDTIIKQFTMLQLFSK